MRTQLTLAAAMLALSPALAYASPPQQSSTRATVTVQNDQKDSVTVYAQRGEEDIRLGQVPALGIATFTVPDWLSLDRDEVQFFVHPKDGFDLGSGTVDLSPGEHLGLLVRGR